MRNLKRVLSLVLAAMMLIGMMVVGASAANALDFTDYDEIQHQEAVNTMVALNVIAGKEDGSYFAPSDTLTREEMSKIIAYVVNGGVEPVVGVKPVPTYADIDDNWAEKYIEYCTSAGIIAGDGTGNFNPKGTLTGEQAAKMLLTAMGYNAEVFGFVGNNWAINVNRYANEAGLYEDLADIDPSEPISRDDAMQLAYNAIQAPLMIRTWNQNQATGEVTEVYRLAVDDAGATVNSLLIDKFDGTIKLGYLVAFDYDENKGQWTYYFNGGAHFGGNAIDANDNISSISIDADNNTVIYGTRALKSTVDYTGFYGQQVKVIFNTEKNDVIYGVYANDSSVIVEGATGNVEEVSTNSNTATVSGVDYKLDRAAEDIDVYNFNGGNANVDLDELVPNDDGDNLDAYTFKLVDNTGDGKIDAVIRTPMTIAKINYVGKDSVQFGSGIGSVKLDDLVTYDGFAAGDWVCYIEAANAVLGEDTIQKIDLQSATVDAVRGGDGANTYTEYQINGEWLAGSETNSIYGTNYNTLVEKAEVSDTVEYVALGSTIFYAKIVDLGSTSKNIAMIVTAGVDRSTSGQVSGDTLQAKLLLADGSKTTVSVSKLNGDEVDDTDVAALQAEIGTLVTYRVDGSDYELTSVSPTNLAGYLNYVTANPGYVDGKVNGYELADDAVVYFGNSFAPGSANKGDVYTGKEIKNTWGTATKNVYTVTLTQEVNGFTYAKVVLMIDATLPTVTAGSNYGYLVAATSRSEVSGKYYLNYTILTKDGVIEVTEENTDAPNLYPRGSVVTFDMVSDGVVKNVNLAYVETGKVTGWDGDSKISLDNTVSKIDDSETTILYVDSNKMTAAEGGSIQKWADNDGDGIADAVEPNNVRYILAANHVVLLVVDVNNDMQANPAAGLVTAPVSADTAEAADINAILSGNDATAVSISAGTNPLDLDKAIDVPAKKTLQVSGDIDNLTANLEKDAVVKLGAATYTTDNDAASVSIVDGAWTLTNVTLTGSADLSEMDTTFNAVTVDEGASLKVDANTDGNLPAGTLTIAAGGTLTSMTTDDSNEAVTFVGTTTDARIQTAADTEVSVDFDALTMDISGDATIPAGQTWYAMFDSTPNSKGIAMTLSSGTLTVNGELKLTKADGTGSSLTVDTEASVLVGSNGKVTVASMGTLTVNGSFIGTDTTSALSVAAAQNGATITGMDSVGVADHSAGEYTWNGTAWATSTP
ncbi:S-layer homology domain-containing protein [Pseudoflavonifractor phocaeensis]|uniref:S-layer homology domain-containing protein n=1 Tax=Pseudoflavonifractor phocaeensis TaxID=1870988 RepID=UPI00195BF2EB|nr:S-layer homology domain-containing protein [Pseudoflavonifractor phocaeensis]MBM6927427.1 S-layer homology domain-containing protein [Pseudoflavonifractor phocaeensis]